MRPPLTGAFVARRRPAVVKRALPGLPYSLDDGLGFRRIESDGRKHIEILALAQASPDLGLDLVSDLFRERLVVVRKIDMAPGWGAAATGEEQGSDQ